MRKILAKVDEARLGRAIAGLVTRALVVERVERVDGGVRAKICSFGKRGVKVYMVGLKVVGRGHGVFCSCEDWSVRGVHCKHIAALALHELGAVAQARSERSEVGLLLQL